MSNKQETTNFLNQELAKRAKKLGRKVRDEQKNVDVRFANKVKLKHAKSK